MYLVIYHELHSSSFKLFKKPLRLCSHLNRLVLLILFLCQTSCLSPPNYAAQADELAGDSAENSAGAINEQTDQMIEQTDQMIDVSDMGERDADLPPPDVVRFNMDGEKLIASSSRLRVVWDPEQGLAPIEMSRGDGLNYVWTAESDGFSSLQRLTGVLFFNRFNEQHVFTSWRSVTQAQVLHEGPGVVRLQVSWVARNSSEETSMSGVTTWTIHDDGRLMRDERIELTYPSTGWLVGYHSVPIERVDRIEFNLNDDIISIPAVSRLESRDNREVFGRSVQPSWLCVTGSDSSLLFSAHSAQPSFEGHRATWGSDQEDGSVDSLKLEFDWLRDEPTGSQTWSGTIFTGISADCQQLRRYLFNHNNPSNLELIKGEFYKRMAGDHDEDGYHEGGGFYVVQPDSNEVSFNITSMAPPSFTILVMTDIVSEPTLLSADGELPPQSFISSQGEEGWYVHVRHPPFNSGGVLTITFP